jgi:hypothetical protein
VQVVDKAHEDPEDDYDHRGEQGMRRHISKRLCDHVLMGITVLVLSALMSAPAAFAQLEEEELEVELNVTGATVDTSGLVTVVGTVICSEPAHVFNVCVELAQPAGRTKSVVGSDCDDIDLEQPPDCDAETPYHFSFLVLPFNGRFLPGKAFLSSNTQACTVMNECETDQFRGQRVRLRH